MKYILILTCLILISCDSSIEDRKGCGNCYSQFNQMVKDNEQCKELAKCVGGEEGAKIDSEGYCFIELNPGWVYIRESNYTEISIKKDLIKETLKICEEAKKQVKCTEIIYEDDDEYKYPYCKVKYNENDRTREICLDNDVVKAMKGIKRKEK